MTADAVASHTADMNEPGHIDEVIAGNVRATRARLRMTQEDLADAMDWSRRTVTSLETGTRRVTVADLIGLCKALGVDQSELLRGAPADALEALGLR
jgi:transcriptional regulator with XRE-family HTH domain